MTGTDLLRDAARELYSSDPDAFVERRKALAEQARAAGQAAAAKQIAALRKPTRSAWAVNRLVQAAPEVPGELASLGDELLAAQRSLDGAAIRELSQRRRQLIDTLVRRAFTVTGQHDPPAALRDDVAATLGAALADPQVAAQLASATLTRAAHGEGFGPVGPPALSVLSGGGAGTGGGAGATGGAGAATEAPPKTAPGRAREPKRAKQTAQERAEAKAQAAEASARAKAEAQAQAEAERERRRQEIADAAERAVTEADQAAQAATAAEQEHEDLVERLEVRLADAREALAKTRSAARRARNRQHQARQALARLRK